MCMCFLFVHICVKYLSHVCMIFDFISICCSLRLSMFFICVPFFHMWRFTIHMRGGVRLMKEGGVAGAGETHYHNS